MGMGISTCMQELAQKRKRPMSTLNGIHLRQITSLFDKSKLQSQFSVRNQTGALIQIRKK
jgi:hypothetical protein